MKKRIQSNLNVNLLDFWKTFNWLIPASKQKNNKKKCSKAMQIRNHSIFFFNLALWNYKLFTCVDTGTSQLKIFEKSNKFSFKLDCIHFFTCYMECFLVIWKNEYNPTWTWTCWTSGRPLIDWYLHQNRKIINKGVQKIFSFFKLFPFEITKIPNLSFMF